MSARRIFRTGGLFSVALSVTVPFPDRPPGVTRRVALQLSGLAAFHWVSGLSSRALRAIFVRTLRALRQRSPSPPANFILHYYFISWISRRRCLLPQPKPHCVL